jgi:uncharacterized protein YjbI with pentapeptide repeats
VDAVAEAERYAGILRNGLDKLPDEQQPTWIVRLLHEMSSLAREVADSGASRTGRARLRQLQEEFAGRLEDILDRPVLPPPMQRHRPELLEPLLEKNRLARVPQLVGYYYTGIRGQRGPRRSPFSRSFNGAMIIDCRFVDVDFSEAEFDETTTLVRTRFINCSFDRVQARRLRASSLVFDGCTFNGADFSNGTFGYCVFRNSITSADVSLANCAFSACDMRELDFPRVTLAGASFTECSLDRSRLTDGGGYAAVFCETSLTDSYLGGMDLQNAVFRNADVRGTSFGPGENPATLDGTNLKTAFHLAEAHISEDQKGASSWAPSWKPPAPDFVAQFESALAALDATQQGLSADLSVREPAKSRRG